MTTAISRRRFLSLAAVSTAALAAGCGKSAKSGGTQGAVTTPNFHDAAKLTFEFGKPVPGQTQYPDWLIGSSKMYTAKHPKITFEIIDTLSSNDYLAKITSQMAAGSSPDVFVGWAYDRLAPYASGGKVINLEPFLNKAPDIKSKISQPALDSVTVDGGIYGVPTTFNAEVIFYHKGHFSDNNIEVPTTYEEFVSAVDKLKSAGITPIALGNKESWNGSILYTMLAERLGGFPLYQDTVLKLAKPFNNDAYVKAGQMMQDLVKRGAFNSNFASQDITYAQSLLANGKSAMFINGDWELAGLYSSLGDKLGWFTLPPVSGGADNEKQQMVGGANNALCVGTSSKNHALAADFIIYLMSEERQKAEAKANQLIATTYQLDASDGIDITRSIHQALSDAPHVMIPWDNPLGVYLGEKFDDATQTMYQGQDVVKALSDFDKLVKTHGK